LKADIVEESVTKDGNAFQTRAPAIIVIVIIISDNHFYCSNCKKNACALQLSTVKKLKPIKMKTTGNFKMCGK